MRRLLILFILSSPLLSKAQYFWDIGVSFGASNYLGEIGGDEKFRRGFIADLKMTQTHIAPGAFVRYRVLRSLYLQGSFNSLTISGADSLSGNEGRYGRNLSFKNNIMEASVQAQLVLYELNDLIKRTRYRNGLKAYVFAGVAGYRHNPKALYQGDWVSLQPLKTEGQAQPYSLMGIAIPAGAGVFFTINRQYRFGWDINWRTTFTDYLDDISTFYTSPYNLESPEAIALANRTLENPKISEGLAANFVPGFKRGDPSHTDSYLSSSISASYLIRGKSSFYKARYGSLFSRKKYLKRKIRAKF